MRRLFLVHLMFSHNFAKFVHGSTQSGLSLIKTGWNMYSRALENSPIITKALTSATGFLGGDVLAQVAEKNQGTSANQMEIKNAFDISRTLRMASFGFLLHGPLCHGIFTILAAAFPGSSPVQVAAKVAMDQLFFCPIFSIIFLSYMGFCSGHKPNVILQEVEQNLWLAVKTSWSVWPIANAINFAYVPLSYQVLYVNVVTLFYCVFLSRLGNKKVCERTG